MRHSLKKYYNVSNTILTETSLKKWSQIFRFVFPKRNPGASLIYRKKVPRIQLCWWGFIEKFSFISGDELFNSYPTDYSLFCIPFWNKPLKWILEQYISNTHCARFNIPISFPIPFNLILHVPILKISHQIWKEMILILKILKTGYNFNWIFLGILYAERCSKREYHILFEMKTSLSWENHLAFYQLQMWA